MKQYIRVFYIMELQSYVLFFQNSYNGLVAESRTSRDYKAFNNIMQLSQKRYTEFDYYF